MANLNRWEGIGRLGKEIELRYLPNGNAVANFSIACDDSYKDKQTGQKVEKTEWVRCVAFGKTGEYLSKWLLKGNRILVVGKLTTREYEKNGEKRYVTEIVVGQGTEIIDWPPKDGQQQRQAPQQSAQQQQRQAAPQQAYDPSNDFSDDIPF